MTQVFREYIMEELFLTETNLCSHLSMNEENLRRLFYADESKDKRQIQWNSDLKLLSYLSSPGLRPIAL